jgi:hypothetical protein
MYNYILYVSTDLLFINCFHAFHSLFFYLFSIRLEKEKKIHALGGIRTRNSSKSAAASSHTKARSSESTFS